MRAPFSAPLAVLALLILASCGTAPNAKPEGHLTAETPRPTPTGPIPAPVRSIPMPPPPDAKAAELRYSVVVANQPVRDVLLAMARETQVNFDIHPGIEGTITLNAIDQTLKQILTRISKQVDMRWEADGANISVMPDTPYLRSYKIDYVNMTRDVSGTVGIQSQVVGPGGTQSGAGSGAAQNSSLLKVDNVAKNRFWETLERNIKDILRDTDKLLPEGSSETFVSGRAASVSNSSQRTTQTPRRTTTTGTTTTTTPGTGETQQDSETVERRLTFRESASVIVSPESGILTVRATFRQQERVAEFIEMVSSSIKRQVMIEATVVEVVLDDRYQSGVDWSALALDGLGYSFRSNFMQSATSNLTDTPFFSATYSNPNAAAGGSISSTVKLLDTFGKTRVLSSPKIMALNNQTAVLKVVDNRVYFTISAQVTPAQGNAQPIVVFTTTQNVVPIGFVMNVTPQIADNDVVVLNVRPTVSRILGYVNDPNPSLAQFNVISRVPEIQSREFESVLRVASGQTAVLGGLMQDSFDGQTNGLPLLSRIPIFGDAVAYRDDRSRKSELVIFLRPIVVRDASVDGDLRDYHRYLPDREFFRDTESVLPKVHEGLRRMRRGESPAAPEPAPPEDPAREPAR